MKVEGLQPPSLHVVAGASQIVKDVVECCSAQEFVLLYTDYKGMDSFSP